MAISRPLSAILSVLVITSGAASMESVAHVHSHASHAASLRSILLQQNAAQEPQVNAVSDGAAAVPPVLGSDVAASTGAAPPAATDLAAGASLLAGQSDPSLSSATQVSAPVPQAVPGIAALQQTTGAGKLSAFGQIATLDAEFNALHLDDQGHIRQLSFNVHLREKLREQLNAAQQQLLNDNLQLAQRTARIVGSGEAPGGAVENANATSASDAAALLQQRQLTSEQIAADALQRVKALEADIVALRARDEAEVRAIRNNADVRAQLGQRIVAQRTQLQKDAGSLLEDLGQIHNLAGPQDMAATTVAPQSDSA